LFGTPGTIPHPSPFSVFYVKSVKPKIASTEPWIDLWRKIKFVDFLFFFHKSRPVTAASYKNWVS
jgi:hypothetical protein